MQTTVAWRPSYGSNMTLFGTSLGNLAMGGLTDVFRTAACSAPITIAVMVTMTPWLLAIPCFAIAARMMEKNDG
ncbi:MAG: hypothetical protein HYR68_08985 [Burkholderiales bacterium]|nr:hypothetical protein [Burkholderiales bacterium]MBI3728055.1 hypothetical protein [Burkholderiales bacterium]